MNVKISIELPERYLEFAEGMVRDGAYGSLSELVEEHLRDLMLSRHDDKPTPEQMEAVMAMKDEIRRRMELPDDQWIPMDENDDMFERLEARLKEKYGAAD